MKALSIRQPWAWLILHGKDVENRTWRTTFRGKFLIHASLTFDNEAYETLKECGVKMPVKDKFKRGGIVGRAELVDCVDRSNSPWFLGPHGFVLENARPLPFRKCKGRLNFFNVKA